MEQKQKLLRQQILQKGYDPSKFYEYWENVGLDFQNVDYQELKIIVQTYAQTYLQHQKNQEDQQFDDYQQSNVEKGGNVISQPPANQQPDVYADFDWELLMGHHFVKKQDNLNNKPVIKKLPKQFGKKQHQTKQSLSKQTTKKDSRSQNSNKVVKKTQTTSKALKQGASKNANLMQDLDVSLSEGNARQLTETSHSQPNPRHFQKSFSITFKQLQSQSTKQKVKCLKLQQNILDHHKNVQISITNVQELQGESSLINKLWKGNEYLYSIKTIGRNKNRSIGISWEIKRKYSDFEWLRNTLLRFYPGIIVPPMPPFPKTKERIQGQKKKLENFLMDAYRCPELRNSKYFQVFLSYGNFSDFQGFKKSTQTVSKPKQISNILNMKGQVDLLYGANIQLFSAGIQQYLNKSSQHLKNVKTILNQIKGFYDDISNCYTKLSDVFELMSHEQKCFPKLTQTYKQIASLISKHSTFCVQQKSNIDTYMVNHFSYEKDRIDNMQSLNAKKNQFTAQLGRRQPKQQSGGMFGKLTGGVASLFGQKSESLQIPSPNYEKLYKQVGFYNNQLLNQMIRCVQVMIQSQIDHFSGYGISRIDSVDKLQKTWSQIMVQLSKLNMQ